ncbi:MAG: IclR family transcriptional regulator [Clostridiales Family XIII bacterium]|jgi:DNA-binding IclR family transcriptional regulator|nr:IclR family transcriptional regulator [Clostridiales Family XIII bacterium]
MSTIHEENGNLEKKEHQSTSRVLKILDFLSTSKNGFTLTEIATQLNAPKSSILPILSTMCAYGFIQCSSQNRKSCYRIGLKSYIVGSSFSKNRTAQNFIVEYMKRMVDILNETSQLGILSGNSVYYVNRVEGKNPIALRSQIQILLPAYCTGIGKALLSNHDRKELQRLYPDGLVTYTPQTIPTIAELERQLKEVRKSGFAYEHSEYVEGVECIAVPLCRGRKVIAAVSFSVPTYRIDDKFTAAAQKLLAKFRTEVEDYFQKYDISLGADLL